MTPLAKKWARTGLLDGFSEAECDRLSPILEHSAKGYVNKTYDGRVTFNPQTIHDQLRDIIKDFKNE